MAAFLQDLSDEQLINHLFMELECNGEFNNEFNIIEDIKNEILFRMRPAKK